MNFSIFNSKVINTWKMCEYFVSSFWCWFRLNCREWGSEHPRECTHTYTLTYNHDKIMSSICDLFSIVADFITSQKCMVQKMFIMHFGAYLWFNCIRFGMTTHHSKVTHHFRSIPWMANSRKTLNENIFKRFDIAWTTACLDMTILRHNFYVIFVYGAIAALFLYSLWLNLFLFFFPPFFLNSVSVVVFFSLHLWSQFACTVIQYMHCIQLWILNLSN